MDVLVRMLAMIGMALSGYALYVTRCLKKNPNYKAACDIDERISCTKALKSAQGNILFFPNSFYGIVFYFLLFFVSYFSKGLVLFLSFLAFLASVYLGYVLYGKMKIICLVCTGVYVVNFLLVVCGLWWL